MKICVFCGASPQVSKSYLRYAYETGSLLASAAEYVVFGGGANGMMGALADGVVESDGRIIGILPRFLFDREPPHPEVYDIRVVDNMHERKAMMYDLSDSFLVLPGGYGTMDETMEVVTWRQLSLHDKPVVFIGQDDFWKGLESTFDTMHQHRFLSDRDRELVSFVRSTEDALDKLRG